MMFRREDGDRLNKDPKVDLKAIDIRSLKAVFIAQAESGIECIHWIENNLLYLQEGIELD